MAALLDEPLVQKHVSCKKKCSACCHTQVSITSDEADLLVSKIADGVFVDIQRLSRLSTCENDSSEFYKINYLQRACPFLEDNGLCSVYDNRPSVCRSNHVVSDPSFCESTDGKERPVQLLNTYKADMVIMAQFKSSRENGALPVMIIKALNKLEKRTSNAIVNKA